MACTYADLEYLVSRFPFVKVTMQGVWRVRVVNAIDGGQYTIEINEVPYQHTAVLGETVTDIRNGLQTALAGQLDVSVSAYGVNALDLTENVLEGVEGISVTGPNEGDITLETRVPQDNSEFLELMLEATKCGVNCCYITCPGDQQLYHAALTAHYFLSLWNTGSNGVNEADWDLLKLGPATMRKTSSAASANKSFLQTTPPGLMVLALRDRYIPKVFCA